MKEALNLKHIKKKEIIIILIIFLLSSCEYERKFIGTYKFIKMEEFRHRDMSNYIERRKDSCIIELYKDRTFNYSCNLFGIGATSIKGQWEINNKIIILLPEFDSVLSVDNLPLYPRKFLINQDTLKVLNVNKLVHQNRIFIK